jgi:hypothetical protein
VTGRALDAWWDDGALAGTFVELASQQVEFRYAEVDLDRGLALAIGGAESIDDANWIEFGRDQIGLSRRYVRRALDALRGRLLESLRPTADRLLESEPGAEIAIDAVRATLEQRHGWVAAWVPGRGSAVVNVGSAGGRPGFTAKMARP